MPHELELKLLKEAKSRGYGKKRTGAFVYGTMQDKTNWKPHQDKNIRHKAVEMLKKKKGK